MRRAPARAVASWILYDFANTIYSMNVVTMYFPLWMTVNLAMEDIWVSVGNSLSMVLVGLTMPVLGVVSDRFRARMPYLIALTLLCVAGTAMIGIVGALGMPGLPTALCALLFYILANFAYQGSLVFYNALLPEVSTPRTMGKISGYGVAVGYLGSFFGLLVVMPFVTGGIEFLGIEVPFLRGQEVEVARLEGGERAYLDVSVGRDAHYEYILKAVDAQGKARALPMRIQARDTTLAPQGEGARRAVMVRWQAPVHEDVRTWRLYRHQGGWGHVGSFLPTGFLFLLTAIPTFVFVRDRQPVPSKTREMARNSLQAALPAAAYVPFLLAAPLAVGGCVLWRLAARRLQGESGRVEVGSVLAAYHRFVLRKILQPVFPGAHEFEETAQRIVAGLAKSKETPGVLRFLAAKFFYEEAVETIIIFMAVYAVKVVGFSSDVVVPFFLVATTAAAIGSFLFGLLTDRFGPKSALTVVLTGWIVSLVLVVAIDNRALFWGLACAIGMFLGGTWTSARPLLVTLVPAARLGEFFGLYSLSGKAAAITGPLLWGTVVYALGAYGDEVKYKAAVAALALLMLVGRLLLRGVPDRWQRHSPLSHA
ncbi:MAG: MFS transporter [bacterium]|jgi:MFS-type transporter involved in bile tolerance (Atg22 family)|nr:MFS transporter [candidate division KSB1 bacterium]MDH7560404.1 MFS transporter [bacterium]